MADGLGHSGNADLFTPADSVHGHLSPGFDQGRGQLEPAAGLEPATC